MGGHWNIVEVTDDSKARHAAHRYLVENTETGEVKRVAADTEEDVGEEIAKGNFVEDEAD